MLQTLVVSCLLTIIVGSSWALLEDSPYVLVRKICGLILALCALPYLFLLQVVVSMWANVFQGSNGILLFSGMLGVIAIMFLWMMLPLFAGWILLRLVGVTDKGFGKYLLSKPRSLESRGKTE